MALQIRLWLKRCSLLLIAVLVVIKFGDTLRPSFWASPPEQKLHDDIESDPTVAMRRFERDFFRSRPEPEIRNEKCDACRLIAIMFDIAFENAEQRSLNLASSVHNRAPDSEYENELVESEVTAVIGQVCRKKTFRSVYPIMVHSEARLVAQGLETSFHVNKLHSFSQPSPDDGFWPLRIKALCRLYAEKLPGKEMYDMWLRTSAGSANTFEQFLCFGQGVFANCLQQGDPLEVQIQQHFEDDEEDQGKDEDNEEFRMM